MTNCKTAEFGLLKQTDNKIYFKSMCLVLEHNLDGFSIKCVQATKCNQILKKKLKSNECQVMEW